MRAPITDKHLLEMMWERFPEIMQRGAEQHKPVGYVAENGVVDWNVCAPPIMTDLYTSPPTLSLAQRKTLTDEEIKAASLQAGMQEHYMGFHSGFIRFTRAIEAKLKERTHDLQTPMGAV